MFEGRRSSINYVLEGEALGEGRAGKGVADFSIFGEGQEGRASGFRSINAALVPLYVNLFIKKYLPIKTLSKMMDSSVKNLGKVEYDIQICLRYQE